MFYRQFKDRIVLPRFDWLCPDLERPYTFNIFSGSTCTDTSRGCVDTLTYDYKVKPVQEEGKPPYFRASYRVAMYWPKDVNEGDQGEKDFECTPEGLEEARDWLYAELKRLLFTI